MDQSYMLSLQPRVLIVDNDISTRESQAELLSYWGYKSIIATGSGEGLFKDALLKARENRCQIALVDMRMADDTDFDDKSGLDLIRELAPAECIVVTGFGNDQIAAEILEESGAIAYVGKQYGPDVLKQKLDRLAQKNCSAFHRTKIGAQNVLDYITKIFASEIPEEYRDQIGDVLVRLFPRAEQLRIEKLGGGQKVSSVEIVPRPRSVILKVYEDNRQPVIVKLARARKIQIESDKFQNFIDGHIVGYRHPRLEKSEVLWDIGGALYSSLDITDIRTFPRFYIGSDFEKIKRSLEQFFSETWSDLYKHTKKSIKAPLIELYCKVWGDEWLLDRVAKFGGIDAKDLAVGKHWEEYGGLDPLLWVQQNLANGPEGILKHEEETNVCITHGDLHGGNLLIDQNDTAWVIDFERSGEGHILQDFVELEADIIIRLASHNQNITEFYKLCLIIIRPDEIRKFRPQEMLCNDADYGKALQTISLLRSLARKCTGISDARQYLLGLLFNAIFRATLTKRDFRDTGQLRALMLASIICHRLDHWDKPWPPLEWKSFLKIGEVQ